MVTVFHRLFTSYFDFMHKGESNPPGLSNRLTPKLLQFLKCISELGETPGAGGGQNTDPQSMDYPNGLPKWTTLKWTTPKNTISDYILTLHDLRGLQPPF